MYYGKLSVGDTALDERSHDVDISLQEAFSISMRGCIAGIDEGNVHLQSPVSQPHTVDVPSCSPPAQLHIASLCTFGFIDMAVLGENYPHEHGYVVRSVDFGTNEAAGTLLEQRSPNIGHPHNLEEIPILLRRGLQVPFNEDIARVLGNCPFRYHTGQNRKHCVN